ncbi:Hypothetical protein A7982_01497 [Minicystis rosea]|nr:Hypothetical protein A7982_01497 [Minicystis rosea]
MGMPIDPLEEARVFLPASVEAWPDALAAMPHEDAATLVTDLYRAWLEGALGTALFDAEGPIAQSDADRRMGRMFLRLPKPLRLGDMSIEMGPSSEHDLCRWCWAPAWTFCSQDEDLLVMSDGCVAPLLEEARAGCPKRDYVISIVEHHARDRAHGHLWNNAAGLDAVLAKVRDWIVLSRDAGAVELTAYLERLASYAEPRRVSREEAITRVFDLRRCDPERHRAPEVSLSGGQWVARFDWLVVGAATLHIDVESGRMWAELPPK